MAAVGELIAIVAVVIVLVFWVVVAVTATRVVRGVRRRYRRLRTSLVPASVVAAGSSAPESVSLRGLTAATVGSPVWWAVQHDRHRMWREVTAAEHAVRVAQEAGAPVGDLPDLTRQLSGAARGVDAVLRASGHTPAVRRDVAAERERIEAAAADVHRAAVDSIKATVDTDTDPLVSAIRVEVAALAAGVRSAGYRSRG